MSSQLDIEDEINLRSLEPVILKKRMLEILESDPWNKTSLKVLSELEFGDSSRLYRIDALKSESSDLELAREFVIWEVEEEIMGSEKKRIERLCYRIGRIIELISINCDDFIQKYCEILERAVDELKQENKTEHAIFLLKSSLILEDRVEGLIKSILPMNLPCTKAAIVEILDGDRDDIVTRVLIIEMAENPYLFTDLKIRQLVSKKIFGFGFYSLSYFFSMKSIELNPQDSVSASIALESSIKLGEDEKILLAGGILMSMKKEPKGVSFGDIAAAAVRNGNSGYARDLLLRRRMKLDLTGHRLRLGIPFHEGDLDSVFEDFERTPKPFSDNDSIKTYNALALIHGIIKKDTLRAIGEVGDPLEKSLLNYYNSHFNEDYIKAMWSLNEHFSKNGMSVIKEDWAESKCNFLKLEGNKTDFLTEDRGLVSVIMTCHRDNEALELAIGSIFKQTYPNVEFIFVDDHSTISDVKKYDEIFKDKKVKRIRMSENSGTYACRNAGIEIAEGEFITFADSDDWVNPNKIANSIQVLEGEGADLVVGRYIRMAPNGRILWNGVRFARFALMGMTFRAEALKERLFGFDQRTRHSADSEIFERSRKILGEKKVVRYPTVEIIALESGSNLTSEGELAIDWVGTTGERVRYAESYRKWHDELNSNSIMGSDRLFQFKIGEENNSEYERKLEKLFDFQDIVSEFSSDGITENDEILVTMCTYPGGFSTLCRALESLLDYQSVPITKLRLTVNGGEMPEDLPSDPRLEVILSAEDVTDKGKFIQIREHDGYVITVDDDIYYPEDYVEKMIEHIEFFDRKYLIGVHGAHVPEGPGITRWWEYMNYRRSLVFPNEMPTYIPVNIIGTGTLAFHTSIGIPNHEEFDYQRMVDLHLGVWAQKNKIPMVVCPRRRDWLEEIEAGYVGKIWDSARDDSKLQHRMLEVLQRAARWTIHAKRNWSEFTNTGVFSIFEDWNSRELPPGMLLPKIEGIFDELSEEPFVTIYIPAYNCEEFVLDSIDSALTQSYQNFEICVHDDGSSDGTLKKIKKKYRFNRKVKISSGENGGIGHASNSAISRGRGELILQLDSDDILHPEALAELIPLINEGVVCAYGSFIRIDENSEKIDDGWDWPIYSHPRLMRSMIIHHPRLFRREGWEQIKGFDTDLVNGVDYDFFLRLAEIGEFAHTSNKLYSYRIHGTSTSQEKYETQTRNTFLVQQAAMKRMSLHEFTNFSPNPDFPRRIQYSFSGFMNS